MMVSGTVKENWNQELPGWLKVEYLAGESGKCLSGWMPFLSAYAGEGYGCYCLPEIGAQVVVGFLHGDEEQPFVMGCLMGQQNHMADEVPGKGNERKAFRTAKGYEAVIDEKEETISLADPKGENTLALNGKEGSLKLCCKTSVEIVIDGEPVLKLEKKKASVLDKVIITDDLEVTAGKVKAEASGGVSIKGQSVTVNGNTLKLDGKQLNLKGTQFKAEGTSLELKAGASGKLEASGILQIKGSMLKLN